MAGNRIPPWPYYRSAWRQRQVSDRRTEAIYNCLMDDNTTKVMLTAIIFASLVAVLWRFGRVSLDVERLNFNLLGWLKLSMGALKVTLQRHPEQYANSPFVQGSVALRTKILQGSHDVDFIVLTHPDADHRDGLLHLIECK